MVDLIQDDFEVAAKFHGHSSFEIAEIYGDALNVAQTAQAFAQHRLAAEARGRIEGAKMMQEAAAKKAAYYREVLAYDWASAEAADRVSETIRTLNPETIAKGK